MEKASGNFQQTFGRVEHEVALKLPGQGGRLEIRDFIEVMIKLRD